MKTSNQPAHTAHHHQNLFTHRTANRISVNLALLASMAADQAMLVDLVTESPSTIVAELSEISRRLDSISTEIVESPK